jgi:hypothetical protein
MKATVVINQLIGLGGMARGSNICVRCSMSKGVEDGRQAAHAAGGPHLKQP